MRRFALATAPPNLARMAVALSPSLSEHQRQTARRPAVRVRVASTRGGHDVLRWELEDGASGGNNPVAVVVSQSTALVALMRTGAEVHKFAVVNPAHGALTLSWANQFAAQSGSGIGLSAQPSSNNVGVVYYRSSDLRFRLSTNNGSTWGSEGTVDTAPTAAGPCAFAFAPDGSGCAFWSNRPGISSGCVGQPAARGGALRRGRT